MPTFDDLPYTPTFPGHIALMELDEREGVGYHRPGNKQG
jgi:hypothetical protein